MASTAIGIKYVTRNNLSNLVVPPDLIRILQRAQNVAALTGAGISAESGIPTFRETQTGLWARFRPEDLATPQAFQNNPQLVWNWYQWRRDLISKAKPNPGHFALAQLQDLIPEFTLITQNVDGLHQFAGSQNVVELHGNILRNRCFDCGLRVIDDLTQPSKEIPRCNRCGGLLRPDVIWFGENLPQEAIQAAWKAAERSEVFFAIGTSAIVQPAASLPSIALQNKAVVIEINPKVTPFTEMATYRLQGKAGEILPCLIKQVWK